MDEYLSVIKLFSAGTYYTPQGWMPCEGQLIKISDNNALFALLGTQFGGDGTTTFALPNLRTAAPAPHLRYLICVQGLFPSS
jgi:microcystin-dependent protein